MFKVHNSFVNLDWRRRVHYTAECSCGIQKSLHFWQLIHRTLKPCLSIVNWLENSWGFEVFVYHTVCKKIKQTLEKLFKKRQLQIFFHIYSPIGFLLYFSYYMLIVLLVFVLCATYTELLNLSFRMLNHLINTFAKVYQNLWRRVKGFERTQVIDIKEVALTLNWGFWVTCDFHMW